jgi:hypothetical protein
MSMEVPQKTKNRNTIWPCFIPSLAYMKEYKSTYSLDKYTFMFIAAVFTIVKVKK